MIGSDVHHLYFYLAVIDHDEVAGFYIIVQVGIGDIDPVLITQALFIGKSDDITGLHLQCVVFNFTDPEFGSLQVSQQGDIVRLRVIDLPDALDDLRFVFQASMREVEPEYIHACLHQSKQLLI
jgi:hypothetical protein